MNDLFIQGLTIDWNRVRPYNYVRQIPAISGIDTFTFRLIEYFHSCYTKTSFNAQNN